jgi:glycosyltransferase involved in cell wall biosynthesis
MRIGIDATALPPQPVGAGNYIIQLIRALIAANTEDEFVVFAQPRGPSLINLPEPNPIEWVIVKDRNPGPRLLWEQVRFPGLISKSGVELLHSLHYTRPLRLPCASVVTFHDMTFFLYPELHTRARRLFFPPVIRMSARRADALIAVSDSTRQDAIRVLGISPEKIFTTQLGVDASFESVKDNGEKSRVIQKYDLPEKFILYVGLIEPRKNLPLLISAYKRLIEHDMDYKLVLVGRYGWMYDQVLAQIADLALESMVQLVGYVPQEDLPLVYNLSSLFVYPTIYEGFGLPVLEAMACGVPVITSDVSALPEIVGEDGKLVPVNDVEALTKAMVLGLSDMDLRQKLINNGLLRAAKFSWERTAQLTLQVYQHVMQTH